jgi:hypothetical protein
MGEPALALTDRAKKGACSRCTLYCIAGLRWPFISMH